MSPGELQRVRLATQIQSHLFGVVYVLDEPSAGLHPADGEALLLALARLRDAGNSLFVVEHDLAVMRQADWIVDVGPDAGTQGGQVLYSGPPAGLQAVSASRTAPYLFAAAAPGTPRTPRTPRTARVWLTLTGLSHNNLKCIDAAFPLGVLTSVTGVSGSGKSSLVAQALIDWVTDHLGNSPTSRHLAGAVQGLRRLVQVDQKPIGRTPRSNLATYTGLFDAVRQRFAASPAAIERHWGAGRFSFNVAGGRCTTCEGEGFVSIELLFMPSVYAPCSTCHGARYNAATLEVLYRDRSIADVLNLTVDAALERFADDPAIQRPLQLLHAIGLGYLRLGQPATELSGGEAQRIKLATELQRPNRGDTLYVLDEPTSGLHPADVDKLMCQLDALVDAGNTVVLVEHDMRVVAASDWVIDLGPGAGDEGGQIVAVGTPAEVAVSTASRTAPYLARALKR